MHLDKVRSFLEKLDLTHEEIKIYLALIKHGNLSASDLSKETKVERTKVYRLLDDLIGRGFVNKIGTESGDVFQAEGEESVKLILLEKERELENLKNSLDAVQENYKLLKSGREIKTDVRFFMGKRGVKQMVWNVTKAKSEVRKMLNKTALKYFGRKFWKEYKKSVKKGGQQHKALYSEDYIESLKGFKIQSIKQQVVSPEYQTYKYISKEYLEINDYILVYDNKVAIFNWSDVHIYGIEILSEGFAAMQKQMFDILWNMGKEEHKLDKVLAKIED
ncbi:hypothetical protein GF362_02180 [Candidatus Dojkabacteria bacterium]|nr:hypothetical protein [Candidatus Dojkabacteria bacterium]